MLLSILFAVFINRSVNCAPRTRRSREAASLTSHEIDRMLHRIVDYPCQIRPAADHHRSGEERRTLQDDQQTIEQLKSNVLFSRRDAKQILDDMVRIWAVKF